MKFTSITRGSPPHLEQIEHSQSLQSAPDREPDGRDRPGLPKNGETKSESCHKLRVSQAFKPVTFLHQTTETK